MHYLLNFFTHRLSFTAKALAFTFIMGILLGWAFDLLQTHYIRDYFRKLAIKDLRTEAERDGVHFHKSIEGIRHLASMISRQQKTFNYVQNLSILNDESSKVVVHSEIPNWLPKDQMLEEGGGVDYVFLFDQHRRVRESYQPVSKNSGFLIMLDKIIIDKSHQQAILTKIDSTLYVLASDRVFGNDGSILATLLVVVCVDERFLNKMNDGASEDRLLAILDSEGKNVWVSSDRSKAPLGASLESLQQSFFIIGNELYNFGSPEVSLHLASFISKSGFNEILDNYVSDLRVNRIYIALGFIIIFSILLLQTTHRIRRLNRLISRFIEKELNLKFPQQQSKDELHRLEFEFYRLMDDVHLYKKLKSREEKRKNRVVKELEDFAYIVSHDLKAPLRAITSLAAWLVDDYKDKLDKAGQETLELLMSRVSRMNDLIDGVLHYSRAGRKSDDIVEINLQSAVLGLIDLLAPPDHIDVRINKELPVVVGEKTRITQVFQNLLSNAVKYIDRDVGGVIEIDFEEEESHFKFSVKDNGPGIDPKFFDQIFKIFQTLQNKDETDSTGIGLSIVKRNIETIHGKIWVESEPGKGTTFFFTIPKVNLPK